MSSWAPVPMTGIRRRAAGLMTATGLLPMLRSAFDIGRSSARVLAYHRVVPRVPEESLFTDVELVSAWLDEFESQMRHLARHYRPMSCSEFVERLDRGAKIPRRTVIVTFDDGFSDNFVHAYPVMRRYEIPATVFVATGYVDTGRRFWFEAVASMVCRTAAARCELSTLAAPIEIAEDLPDRRAALGRLLSHLKGLENGARIRALDELRSCLGVDPDAIDEVEHGPLTWDQVRDMAANGIEFGSHTVSHPVLSRVLDMETLRSELVDSKSAIEREAGRPVIAFAYPVGGASAINEKVLEASRAAGYRLAFTYRAGVTTLRRAERFSLRRLPVERYVDRTMFEALLAAPELFADRPRRRPVAAAPEGAASGGRVTTA
jgi:peptidoglycan/xylan/chitin deacetylase (PgdA/CDA1 family)